MAIAPPDWVSSAAVERARPTFSQVCCSGPPSMAAITRLAGDSSPDCQTSSHKLSPRSEEHTSELQSLRHLVCRLLLEQKKQNASMSVKPLGALDTPSPTSHTIAP